MANFELRFNEGMEISAISQICMAQEEMICVYFILRMEQIMEQYIQIIQYVQSQLPETDRSENIKAIMINTKNANTFTGTQGAEALESLSKKLQKIFLRDPKKGGRSSY